MAKQKMVIGKKVGVKVILVLCIFMMAGQTSYAQKITADTVKVVGFEHSPKKAASYSAMLPGLGQAYNKKYWKIPLIYAGFGAFGYFIDWQNSRYETSRQAYRDLSDNDSTTVSYMKLKNIQYYDLSNPSSVTNLKRGLIQSSDFYRRNRDLLIISTLAFYGLNIIDASVDAHFFNFDMGDDLTFNWEPSLKQQHNQNIFSLNCTIQF